jgi:hypothetical protein
MPEKKFSREVNKKIRDAVLHFTDEMSDISDDSGVGFGELMVSAIEDMVDALALCAKFQEEKNEAEK